MGTAKKKILSIFLFIILFLPILQIAMTYNIIGVKAANLLDKQEGFGASGAIKKEFGVSGAPTDVRIIVARVIKAFLGLLGIIFIILILIAGFNWMTAQGDEQKIEKAKETLSRAVIGLIIIVAAYSITYFVFNNLEWGGSGTTTGSPGGSP